MKPHNLAVTASGYLHPGYAESLKEFGTPLLLERSGGWILKRSIAGFPYNDGMGCYPLFSCKDWSLLIDDFDDLKGELVTLSAVTDPFGEYDESYLRRCFQDVVIPFKEHFVVNLSYPIDSFVSAHHRYYARKAAKIVNTEVVPTPAHCVDEWARLYSVLTARHNIRGISAFSRSSFARQLEVPGIVMFRATHEKSVAGIILWYVQDGVAYSHLSAYADIGYELRASYALFWFALKYFASMGLSWLDLGAAAGLTRNGKEGLDRFKRGWSTGSKTAYFCGRIFDRKKYLEVSKSRGSPETDYFPVYRQGEFG